MYVPPAIQQFATKQAAQAEADKMMGWSNPTVVVNIADGLYQLEDTYSIRVNGNRYLYDDGYVR